MSFSIKHNILKIFKSWIQTAVLVLALAGGTVMTCACAVTGAAPSGDEVEIMKKSPNYKDDQFVNTIPARDPDHFRLKNVRPCLLDREFPARIDEFKFHVHAEGLVSVNPVEMIVYFPESGYKLYDFIESEHALAIRQAGV